MTRERRDQILLTLLPLAATVAALGILSRIYDPQKFGRLLANAVVAFTVAGKFIVFNPVLNPSRFTPFELAALVVFMDVATAMVVTGNLGVLHRVPWLGRRLRLLEAHGRRVRRENKWIRRGGWLSVAAFVMFPVTGTGAVTGSILARLLGIGPWATIGAVAAGSVAGGFGFAVLADRIARPLVHLREEPWFRIGGWIVMGGVLLWLILRAKRLEKEIEALGDRDDAAETSRPKPPI